MNPLANYDLIHSQGFWPGTLPVGVGGSGAVFLLSHSLSRSEPAPMALVVVASEDAQQSIDRSRSEGVRTSLLAAAASYRIRFFAFRPPDVGGVVGHGSRRGQDPPREGGRHPPVGPGRLREHVSRRAHVRPDARVAALAPPGQPDAEALRPGLRDRRHRQPAARHVQGPHDRRDPRGPSRRVGQDRGVREDARRLRFPPQNESVDRHLEGLCVVAGSSPASFPFGCLTFYTRAPLSAGSDLAVSRNFLFFFIYLGSRK